MHRTWPTPFTARGQSGAEQSEACKGLGAGPEHDEGKTNVKVLPFFPSPVTLREQNELPFGPVEASFHVTSVSQCYEKKKPNFQCVWKTWTVNLSPAVKCTSSVDSEQPTTPEPDLACTGTTLGQPNLERVERSCSYVSSAGADVLAVKENFFSDVAFRINKSIKPSESKHCRDSQWWSEYANTCGDCHAIELLLGSTIEKKNLLSFLTAVELSTSQVGVLGIKETHEFWVMEFLVNEVFLWIDSIGMTFLWNWMCSDNPIPPICGGGGGDRHQGLLILHHRVHMYIWQDERSFPKSSLSHTRIGVTPSLRCGVCLTVLLPYFSPDEQNCLLLCLRCSQSNAILLQTSRT